MAEEEIRLIEPCEEFQEAYREFLADFERAGERRDDAPAAEFDFRAYLRRVRGEARGVGLPEGWVPCQAYWLVRGRRVLGECGLRHPLTEALRDFGGNIGYSVRPSERNKGYGTAMLALALGEARRRGLKRVLITCDKDNLISARVIRNNGGVLDSESYSPRAGRVTQRYWIDLREPGGAAAGAAKG